MWLSKKMAAEAAQEMPVAGGIVTVSGAMTAVMTDSEERDARIAAPGGYYWRPEVGQNVLVSRSGGLTVLGRVQENAALAPGEVRIQTGSASIRLLPDGTIRLDGEIYLNGEKWEGSAL